MISDHQKQQAADLITKIDEMCGIVRNLEQTELGKIVTDDEYENLVGGVVFLAIAASSIKRIVATETDTQLIDGLKAIVDRQVRPTSVLIAKINDLLKDNLVSLSQGVSP